MKQRIINWLLRHYLNTVILSDIITIEKGVIKLGGLTITQHELNQLQQEVKALEGMRLWSILTNSLRMIAQDKIFNKSLTFDDVIAGKLMLFNIDTQESIIRVIKSRN